GTSGFLMCNYDEMLVLQQPDVGTPPRTIADSPGHHREWIEATRSDRATGAGAPLCRFEYAAPLTELVLLGTVAYRSGKSVQWNRRAMTSDAAIAALLRETYRDGWAM